MRSNERANEREREIYYCHDPYLISSNREQMGICLVDENEIIFLLNYFIIIRIIIFKKNRKKNSLTGFERHLNI
jgi:hypothetical protein